MYLLETTVEPETTAPLALVANIGFVNESGLPRDRCVGRNFLNVLMALLNADWRDEP